MDAQELAAVEGADGVVPISTAKAKDEQDLFSLTLLCLLFVILADLFFYKQPFGWTLGGYGLLLTAALFFHQRVLPRSAPVILTTAGVVLLFIQCFEEPGALAITLGIFGLCSLGLMLREGWVPSILVWTVRWMRFAAAGWVVFFQDLSKVRLSGRSDENGKRNDLKLFGNWLLGVVLAVVFIALFTSANPVISDWLRTAWQKAGNLFDHFPTAGRILMWVLIMIATWALLQFRTGKHMDLEEKARSLAPAPDRYFAMTLIAKYLLLFNVIFAVQTGLDIYYLWSGAELPKGLTYAAYAHRGAYPLLAAALLAGFFVMATFRSGSATPGAAWARRLVYLWLAQNVFLVVSAGWRLSLYVEVYTLTRWRVAAMIWMFLVACGLVWTVIRIGIGRSNFWLINVNAVTAIVVLFLCAFVNFDGWIGEFNVRNCREVAGQGPPIDLDYLQSLGYDTLPALIWLEGHAPESSLAPRVRTTIERLQQDLQSDLQHWQGWTLQRQRLSRLNPHKLTEENGG